MRTIIPVAFLALSISSPAANAEERTVTLDVKNMYCATCPVTVKASLAAVSGVARVEVSYREKSATITFDDVKATPEALIKATTEAGFPSSIRG